jgi:hypothetical protein
MPEMIHNFLPQFLTDLMDTVSDSQILIAYFIKIKNGFHVPG